MKLKLLSREGDYEFAITDDGDAAIFSSGLHFYVVPGIKPWYKSPWSAYSDGLYVLNKRKSHIESLMRKATEDAPVELVPTDVSAEEMILDQYWKNFKSLNRKAKSAHKKDQDERDKIFNETVIVVAEVETILQNITSEKDKKQLQRLLSAFKKVQTKYFPKELRKHEAEKAKQEAAPPMPAPDMGGMGEGMGAGMGEGMAPVLASKIEKRIADSLLSQVLDHVGEKACEAVHGENHRDPIFVVDEDAREVEILDVCEGTKLPILTLHVNEKLNVDNIMPSKYTSKIHPVHSVEFYQRYWKPVVESLGHIYIPDRDILICSAVSGLPDVPGSFPESFTLGGWNTEKNCADVVDISFKGEDKPIWVFEAAKERKFASNQSQHQEQKYIDAVVKCIDPDLKSLYGRTGVVVQVNPRKDFVEADVDFGRGLGVVRLVDSLLDPSKTQIEVVPLPSKN